MDYRPTMTISAEAIQSPEFESALEQSVTALRRLANFSLESGIGARMQLLGERKEFLSEAEHDELLSLMRFAERRNIEKLEAELALKSLENCFPELAS